MAHGIELQSNALFHPALPAFVKNHFTSKYVQAWLMAINKNYEPSNQNKLRTYASFKTTFGMENYVLSLKLPDRRQFTKLQISSHHLAIETGRYTRPITPRNERWCKDCNNHTIGDEKHFLLSCKS